MVVLHVGTALLVLSVSTFCYLVFNGLFSWIRTAWMLRKLPRGCKNMLYDGLVQMLTTNRLRALQKMNEVTLNGSGVLYFNALWRQVRAHAPAAVVDCVCLLRRVGCKTKP